MSTFDVQSTVLTPYGAVRHVHILTRWPDGTPRDCRCLGPDTVATPQGWLPPLYTTDDVRRTSDRSFSLYPNGMWRSLELQSQCPVPTPMGELPVEWLAWHPNGTLKRVLLRKGKTSGYWTEQDEGRLAHICALDLPAGPVRARVQGLRFYPSGRCASVTFWPGERLTLPTVLGPLPVRNGCAFYESGALRSWPDRPAPCPWLHRPGSSRLLTPQRRPSAATSTLCVSPNRARSADLPPPPACAGPTLRARTP